jgi:N-acetylmuramoyl-L-alanine amidase
MLGVSGHAGLFSSADDLAVLAQTLLNGGGYGKVRLFSESLVNQFSQPSTSDDSVGLGFRLAKNGKRRWHFGCCASEQAYGHTGWTGTATVIDPKYDLAIIWLTNLRHSAVEISYDDDGDRYIDFAAKRFETGKYGSVVSLIYEAVLTAQ